MSETYLVRGDTTPVVFTVTDQAGNLVDLTGATVAFTLRQVRTGTMDVTLASCPVTDAAAGVCQWERSAEEPSAVGEYEGELQVTYAGGQVKHFPDQAGAWLFVVRAATGVVAVVA